MTSVKVQDPVKTGFLRWECDVVAGHTVYTLLGYTRNGVASKALRWGQRYTRAQLLHEQ